MTHVQPGSRRVVAMMTMAAIAVGLLAGCGSGGSSSGSKTSSAGPAKPGGVLRIAQLSEPVSLTPAGIVDTSGEVVSAQINETLYRQSEAGKLVPVLATGYKRSADGLTWNFTIRKGVQFSNGRPLTAEDVVFSMEAARKSAYYAGLWEEIDRVRAVSLDVVEIHTDKPMAAMLSDLTSFTAAVVPDDYAGMSEKEFSSHPIGTGPFQLKSWARGQSLSLTKNVHYWRAGLPLANEVVFTAVSDDNSRLAQFRSGDYDLIRQPAWAQLKSLEEAPGIDINSYGMFQVDGISLNLNSTLFSNEKAREAVNLAVDREGIVSAALKGFGEPGGSFLPPVVTYSDQSIKAPARDLDKAKALLEEAVSEGVSPKFKLITFAGQAYASLACQIVQQDLSEVGFTVELEPLDESAMIEKFSTGEATAALAPYYPAVPDPSELTSFYMAVVAKPYGVDMAPLEALASKASAELDPGKRKQLYAEIQQSVADEQQMIVLDYSPDIWASQEDVAGFEVNAVNNIQLAEAGFTK